VDPDHNIASYVPEVAISRPSIDEAPCLKWVTHDFSAPGGQYVGSAVHGRNGKRVLNWPELQLANPLPYRSLQLGLTGEAARRYADEWTLSISDVTPLAHRIRALVGAGDLTTAAGLLPEETPYEAS
jgi:hypothetical protein